MRRLRRHSIEIAADDYEVEVWADEPAPDSASFVTLFVERNRQRDTETFYVELTPNEARALAALLIVGAEQQERGAPNDGKAPAPEASAKRDSA